MSYHCPWPRMTKSKNLSGAIALLFSDQSLSYLTVRCRMTYSTIDFVKFFEVLIHLPYRGKFPYMVISFQAIWLDDNDLAYGYISSFCISLFNIIVISNEMTEIWSLKVLINYIMRDYIITVQCSCTKFSQHKHIIIRHNISYGFFLAHDKSRDISCAIIQL